jgi:hypothetical protein
LRLIVAKAEFSRPLGPQWLVIYAIGGETWRRRGALRYTSSRRQAVRGLDNGQQRGPG